MVKQVEGSGAKEVLKMLCKDLVNCGLVKKEDEAKRVISEGLMRLSRKYKV